MTYPSAYCVKCKTHTDTLGKHTVMLGNNRRALKGVCPVCATETYRFMPKKDEAKAARELSMIRSSAPSGTIQDIEPLPTTVARHLNRDGRPSVSQELFFYGSVLVVFGLVLVIGLLLFIRYF